MRESAFRWEAGSTADPERRTVRLSPAELVERRHQLQGFEVYVEGGAIIADADLSGLHCHLLAFRAASSVGEMLRHWRPSPRFADCDFSGLAVGHLILAGASFQRCNFSDITVKLQLGTDAVEMTECVLSGHLDGNLSRGHSRLRKYQIRGNDFRRLRGVDFHDGVDWKANSFDLGGTQLILDIDDARNPQVREVFERTDYGQVLTDSLIYQRPINTGQQWTLLDQDSFERAEWSALMGLLGHHRPG